ncbi:transglutaminase family protein [Luteolibacter algae]|uniref:Transglutaminase family protein n=1 Tax=Luteolibacter algae TaxID=454151 RepID=A0ABW5D621_9BACT
MEKVILPPPRLLLGATLLFWGAMTDHGFLGLIIALFIEGANWVGFRWNFGERGCSRAWKITMLLTIVTGALIWLDGDRYTALPKLMVWFPVLLLPLQFVQSYGLNNSMALNSFSFFSDLHRRRNQQLGLENSVIQFNFGNLYFLCTITASALGVFAGRKFFFPALVILVGWLIFSRVKVRIFALVVIVFTASLIGISGQIGLNKLYKWMTNRSIENGAYPSANPTVNKTAIGSLGQLKQSNEMHWRIIPAEGQSPPRLLRLTTYNRYKGTIWKNEIPEAEISGEDDFRELSALALEEGEPFFMLRREMLQSNLRSALPSFQIRGRAQTEDPLPLPGNASTLQNFDMDTPEINPLGTVVIYPKKSIIAGNVRWNDSESPDSPPWEQDLAVDDFESPGIQDIVEEIGLNDLPDAQSKIARLRQWFTREFQYTKYLTIHRARNYQDRPSAIETFLTTSKRGHCEYFATAATLLLRASGVPSRYCVGYSVQERDIARNQYVIRGIHAHAWTRVWNESRKEWVDFDPTPPLWLTVETSGGTESRWLTDGFQRFREDFFIWRNQPENRLRATIVMWTLGLSVMGFVVLRLWRSKLILKEKNSIWQPSDRGIVTPLHSLEKRARRLLPARLPGESYPEWLLKLPTPVPSEKLAEAVALHQQIRFDPAPASTEALWRLEKLATELERFIKDAKNPKSTK